MTFKNALLLTFWFSSTWAISEEVGNTFPQDKSRYNHPELIEKFETQLKPRFGTSSEPAPNWNIEDRMSFHNVPAMSIAVAIDGKLAWAKAYGETVKNGNVKVNSGTLFQVASLSKPVAGIAALKLVSEGKIDLDKPINDYLASWKLPSNQFTEQNDVTLRHLLSHTAGTTIHGFRGYHSKDDIPTSLQIVTGTLPANTGKVEVNQVPGENYRYSGGGFQIVQLLIEDLTKRSFPNFVNSAVFNRLSLHRSNYSYPQTDKNRATGHTGNASTPIGAPGFSYPESAAAGLWSTPTELVAIGTALSKDRQGAHILLPQSLVNQLIPSSANRQGLGFGLNDDGDGVAFVHNGHNPGFSARWINYADGRASVAVLTNSDTGGELIREVLSALGHIYGWKQDAYVVRETIEFDPKWASKLVGHYFFHVNSQAPAASIWIEDKKLWIGGELTKPTRLFPVSETEFFLSKGLNLKLVQDETKEDISLDIEGEIQLVKMPFASAAQQ